MCNVFDAGETILSSGHKTQYLYFIQEGEVLVKDKLMENEIVTLPQYSWFGDYQLLMGSASDLNFVAGDEGVKVLYIPKQLFIEQCISHIGHYAFYFERALSRRRYWKRR
jgi:CRP-like cAMP-binding protein